MIGGNAMLSPAITEAEPMDVVENEELNMSDDEEGTKHKIEKQSFT